MIADTLTIDASALVKLIVQEPDSRRYRDVLGPDTRLIGPAHILAETGEVLSRKMKAGFIDEAHIRNVLAELHDRLELVELAPLLVSAIRLSIDLGVSVYDCLYVITAERASTKLLTADRRLVQRLNDTRYARLLIATDSFTRPQ